MSKDKTPLELVNELADMLINMEEKGLIHESRIIQVEEVMAAIYPKENREYNKANGQVDPNDEEYCPTNPPYTLIDYVENKEQFAEDYKNAINLCVNSNQYFSDIEVAAEMVIDQRNY